VALILAFIQIALLTGMRSGEIRSLRVGQFDWKTPSLRVGKAKTRAGTGREIPMTDDLTEILQAGGLAHEEIRDRSHAAGDHDSIVLGVGADHGKGALPAARLAAHSAHKDGGRPLTIRSRPRI
jgi:Phage integrase family